MSMFISTTMYLNHFHHMIPCLRLKDPCRKTQVQSYRQIKFHGLAVTPHGLEPQIKISAAVNDQVLPSTSDSPLMFLHPLLSYIFVVFILRHALQRCRPQWYLQYATSYDARDDAKEDR